MYWMIEHVLRHIKRRGGWSHYSSLLAKHNMRPFLVILCVFTATWIYSSTIGRSAYTAKITPVWFCSFVCLFSKTLKTIVSTIMVNILSASIAREKSCRRIPFVMDIVQRFTHSYSKILLWRISHHWEYCEQTLTWWDFSSFIWRWGYHPVLLFLRSSFLSYLLLLRKVWSAALESNFGMGTVSWHNPILWFSILSHNYTTWRCMTKEIMWLQPSAPTMTFSHYRRWHRDCCFLPHHLYHFQIHGHAQIRGVLLFC